VCGGAHTFDVRANTDFLHAHYVRTCQHFRREAQARPAAFRGREGHHPLALTDTPVRAVSAIDPTPFCPSDVSLPTGSFFSADVTCSDDDFDRDLSQTSSFFDFKTVTISIVHFVTAPDTVVDDTYKTALLTDTDGTVRGQIDIGSFASWTDQLDFIHDFVKYSNSHPLTLQPAVGGSDTIPSGYGYLHVPCPSIPLFYLPIHC
jgi:hypothetical protein